MSANPILAESIRGNAVENIYRGAFCVCDAHGNIVSAAGDIVRPIFPRSAIKAIQALALFRSGAVKRFNLSNQDMAIACASHHGEAGHVEATNRFLAKIGSQTTDLECGAHVPTNRAAREILKKENEEFTPVHNNCSGKHTGMLAVAKALGVDGKSYISPEHPVQQLVKSCIQDVIGTELVATAWGTDGCSIPTYAAPLQNFAMGFAKMASGSGISEDDLTASEKLFDAMTKHPWLIAGTGAPDTDLMTAFKDNLVLKIGAEGVFCGAIRNKGWGFALKCDDGNMKAAETMIAGLLNSIASPNFDQVSALQARRNQKQFNWNKIHVGTMRARDTEFLKI